MSFETLEATLNYTTVSAVNTRLLALMTQADALVTSETAVRLWVDLRVTLTGGTQTNAVFRITYDVYDDTKTAMDTLIAALTAAVTSIEGASTYTTVTTITGPVKIIVTE